MVNFRQFGSFLAFQRAKNGQLYYEPFQSPSTLTQIPKSAFASQDFTRKGIKLDANSHNFIAISANTLGETTYGYIFDTVNDYVQVLQSGAVPVVGAPKYGALDFSFQSTTTTLAAMYGYGGYAILRPAPYTPNEASLPAWFGSNHYYWECIYAYRIGYGFPQNIHFNGDLGGFVKCKVFYNYVAGASVNVDGWSGSAWANLAVLNLTQQGGGAIMTFDTPNVGGKLAYRFWCNGGADLLSISVLRHVEII